MPSALQRPENLLYLGLFAASSALVLRLQARRSQGLGRALGAFERVAERERLSVACAALFPVLVRLLLLPLRPVPVPHVHDEFGNLLIADTLAHGRLSNPPTDLARSFESTYVIQSPRYASIYPPAFGALLALGQIAGHPFLGVLAATALMSGALCWALRGFVSSPFALLGGLLAGARWGVFSYWGNAYWGGSLAAAGGALVIGGLVRVTRGGAPRSSVPLGIGAGLLLLNRPLEGGILGIAASAYLAGWIWSGRGERLRRTLALAPAVPGLLLGVAAFLAYNAGVTGNPLVMPYRHYYLQTGIPQTFLLERPRAFPPDGDPIVRETYLWCRSLHDAHAAHPLRSIAGRLRDVVRSTYPGLPLLPALLAAPFLLRGRRYALAGVLLGISFAGTCLVSFLLPHYLAPVAVAVLVLTVASLEEAPRRLGRSGAALVAVLLLAEALFLVRTSDQVLSSQTPRGDVAEALLRCGSRHLVFVSHRDSTDFHDAWVANEADLAHAPIVWANALDRDTDARVMRRFPEREVWDLHVELGGHPRLRGRRPQPAGSISLRR